MASALGLGESRVNIYRIGLLVSIISAGVFVTGMRMRKVACSDDSISAAQFIRRRGRVTSISMLLVSAILEGLALGVSVVTAVSGGAVVLMNSRWNSRMLEQTNMHGSCSILLGILALLLGSPIEKRMSTSNAISSSSPFSVGVFVVLSFSATVFVYWKGHIARASDARPSFAKHQKEATADHRCRSSPCFLTLLSALAGSAFSLLMKGFLTQLRSQAITFTSEGLLVAAVVCCGFRTHWFLRALESADNSTILPRMKLLEVTYGLVGGSLLYRDISSMSPLSGSNIVFATALILLGIYLSPNANEATTSQVLPVNDSDITEASISLLVNDYDDIEVIPDVGVSGGDPYQPPTMLYSMSL